MNEIVNPKVHLIVRKERLKVMISEIDANERVSLVKMRENMFLESFGESAFYELSLSTIDNYIGGITAFAFKRYKRQGFRVKDITKVKQFVTELIELITKYRNME